MDINKEIDFSKVTGEVKRFKRWLKINDFKTTLIGQPIVFLLGMIGSRIWLSKGEFTFLWWSVSLVSTFVWFLFVLSAFYIGFKIIQRKSNKI